MNTSNILFELNCSYHPCISFKDNNNLYSNFSLASKLANKPKDLILIYEQDELYSQELLIWANNNSINSCNYKLFEKIWLNNKFIKTKPNSNLKANYFKSYLIFYLVNKQIYKIKLSA